MVDFVYLAEIKIYTIISNDNDYEIMLTGQKGSMSTYRDARNEAYT